MRTLKSIFDFYLNSSIHVGIEVCCFVLITCLRFKVPVVENFLGFVFFGTITGYNFIKYAGVAKLHHISLARNLRLIQLFSFGCFLGFVFFAVQLPISTLLLAAFFGLFTVFYAVPIFPGKKNLRSLKGVKIFVIAFVVAGLTVWVPLVAQQRPADALVAVVFLQRCVFIVALLLPFEIRDLKFDEAELGTIPQRIGVKNAKTLGFCLLGAFVAIEWFKPGNTAPEIASTVFIAVLAAGFLYFSRRQQTHYYTSFWVEATPIFWLFVFGAFQVFFETGVF